MSKEPQPKRNVYVGGLEEQVNEEILHAAFVPFGDIVEVRIDMGYWRLTAFTAVPHGMSILGGQQRTEDSLHTYSFALIYW